jgi:hypothetical protein
MSLVALTLEPRSICTTFKFYVRVIEEDTVQLSLKHVIRRFSHMRQGSPDSLIKLLPSSLSFSIRIQTTLEAFDQ